MSVPLEAVLQKEVTRKEFLGILSLAVGSIFGMEHIIKLLTGKSLSGNHNLPRSHGSGGSYGG